MSHKPTEGVWTAIVTPWKDDLSLDEAAFTKLIEAQIEAGITGVVVAGTTGESPNLSTDETLKLIQIARKVGGDAFGVMAGSGSGNTKASVTLSKQCEEAGADRLLVVTPAYSKPNPDGLRGHFQAVADSVSVPVCLYHVPGRTAQKLPSALICDLIDSCGLESVKEASADIALFSDVVQNSGAQVLSGDDPTFLASRAVGGHGIVSVVTNIFPKAFCAIQRSTEESDYERARAIHQCLRPFIDLLFCETNPVPVKFAAHKLGLCGPHFRLPLAPVSSTNAQNILQDLSRAKEQLASLGV